MDIEANDTELVARLRRLDTGTAGAAPGFDYHGLLERHAARQVRARRRRALARGSAVVLLGLIAGASIWRVGVDAVPQVVERHETPPLPATDPGPSLVRADTYLAVATLEDHIASVDEALNLARAYAPHTPEVQRLERTRAELLDSYAQVRYAQLVSANY
ncbi:MAG TPA: hypothetical protein VFP37_02175 [Steroidobacteraceae bacterium]|nr:hypothetical protein [Steroidobacteraceae bacterium]